MHTNPLPAQNPEWTVWYGRARLGLCLMQPCHGAAKPIQKRTKNAHFKKSPEVYLSTGCMKTNLPPAESRGAKPLPENCRELRPCTGLTKITARKLPRAASLHWAYQNHCAKNCRELRPCTRLTKTTAGKLPRDASLHWAYQNH